MGTRSTVNNYQDALDGVDPDVAYPDTHALAVTVAETVPVELKATKAWAALMVPVGTVQSVQVLPNAPARVAATVRNVGSLPVFVGPTDQGANILTGFRLDPGSADLKLTTRHEIRAIALAQPGEAYPFFDGLAVLDTVRKDSTVGPIDAATLAGGSWATYMLNTFDQAGTVKVEHSRNGGITWVTSANIATTVGQGLVSINPATAFPLRTGLYRVSFTATVAPTTGTLTYILERVPSSPTIGGMLTVTAEHLDG